jgi:hypothetical protein
LRLENCINAGVAGVARRWRRPDLPPITPKWLAMTRRLLPEATQCHLAVAWGAVSCFNLLSEKQKNG